MWLEPVKRTIKTWRLLSVSPFRVIVILIIVTDIHKPTLSEITTKCQGKKMSMMKRKQVNSVYLSICLLHISSGLPVLTRVPLRPSALRQEGGRGRGRHSSQPWRWQDHCGGGNREFFTSNSTISQLILVEIERLLLGRAQHCPQSRMDQVWPRLSHPRTNQRLWAECDQGSSEGISNCYRKGYWSDRSHH